MKDTFTIIISADGREASSIVDARFDLRRLTEVHEVKRASHVEPVSRLLRRAFHYLRRRFGDSGRMAAFSRRWPCRWRINFAPIDGPILAETFRDRQAALDREVEWLSAWMVKGKGDSCQPT